MKKSKIGFTLIEILVVVTIIGLLSTIVLINYSGSKARSSYSRVVAAMNSIVTAAHMYNDVTGSWPLDTPPASMPPDPLFSEYLGSFPSTPCGDLNYAYDWENWTGGLNADDVNDIVRVTFRKQRNGSDTPIYYKCISSNGTCFGPTGVFSGEDISTANLITCRE